MNSHVSVREFTGLCGQIGVLYTHVYTGVYTRVYSGSEHVKSRVSIGSIHVVPFVNSRYSVDKLGVQILLTLESRVSAGSVHVLPNVNSQNSVHKLGVQILLTLVQNTWNHMFKLVQFMFYRT